VAWEREIGWSDYRAVEDHLLGPRGSDRSHLQHKPEGYANRKRYEISGPLVELFERRTADGRWLPVREARHVDAELADAARRAGERHPRTRLGPGATYRVRVPHWYHDDLETNGRRTFVALDTLRFLRGSHVRLSCFLQSLEAKRYSKGPLRGGRYKTFYSPGSERDPLLLSLGIFDPDRARVIEHLEDALSVIAEFDVGYQRPRPGKRDQRDPRRVDFFIDVGDGYGVAAGVRERKASCPRERLHGLCLTAAAAAELVAAAEHEGQPLALGATNVARPRARSDPEDDSKPAPAADRRS
jgi:hypothetical protein